MKKWTYILSLFVVIVTSCKKDNTWHYIERRPNLAINHLAILDHTDSLLIGNWILDSAWHYEFFPSLATLKSIQHYSDPNYCGLQLTPNLIVGNFNDNINWKEGTSGLLSNNETVNWKMRGGYLNLFGSLHSIGAVIKSISSTKLVLDYIEYYPPNGCNPGKSITFYLHK